MAKLIDLIGKKVGRLTVILKAHRDKNHLYWLCECECGNEKLVSGGNLRRESVKSCGCLRDELATKNMKILGDKITHGMSHSREYVTLMKMKERCGNKNHKAFKDYGGRGITVCDRWMESFENFYADMGARPEGHSIERINNDKGYYPENCKWATTIEQNRNRRFKNSKLGITGVQYRIKRKKWEANLSNKYLGMFSTLLDAACARRSAENKYWNVKNE